MRVTTKGQVTIPQYIRDKMMIGPSTEIEFVEEADRVYIVKKKNGNDSFHKFSKLRGIGTVKMTTEEIMTLTRADN